MVLSSSKSLDMAYASRMIRCIDVRISDLLKLFVYASKHVFFFICASINTASTEISTASTKISTTSFSDATVYAFLSTQPQGSQLVHEDLEQLHDDDLEEMDLNWNMALLSMRARKFYQRTGRKIIIDGRKIIIDGNG
ncbi:hypothetical protein Tco_1258928 [Tanacetum coccineum]